MDINKTACFTGHRPNKLGGYDLRSPINQKVGDKLYHLVEMLYKKYGVRHFICGGALGTDQIAFMVVAYFKKTHPDVTLELAIPFAEQAIKWPNRAFLIYESQKQEADIVTYVDELDGYTVLGVDVGKYHVQKMQERNKYMVDKSRYVVAVWNGSDGGTANCVRYARSVDREIVMCGITTKWYWDRDRRGGY